MNKSYNQLLEIFKSIKQLNNILSILRWDSAVIMPKGSIDARSEQITFLTALVHEKLSNNKIAELLNAVSTENLGDWDKANFKLMEKEYKNQTSISADLVKAIAMATSKSEMVWREAKNENNFKLFAPHLKEVLKLTREMAAARAKAFHLSIYDSLLDSYEPNFTSMAIDPIFLSLRKFLPEFIGKAVELQKSRYKSLLQKDFSFCLLK